jgi:hypothetical protein
MSAMGGKRTTGPHQHSRTAPPRRSAEACSRLGAECPPWADRGRSREVCNGWKADTDGKSATGGSRRSMARCGALNDAPRPAEQVRSTRSHQSKIPLLALPSEFSLDQNDHGAGAHDMLLDQARNDRSISRSYRSRLGRPRRLRREIRRQLVPTSDEANRLSRRLETMFWVPLGERAGFLSDPLGQLLAPKP